MNDWKDIFAWIGLCCMSLMVVLAVVNAWHAFKEWIKIKIKAYKDRHILDHPPKGKCYCIACARWYADNKERTMGRCNAWEGYHTSFDEFCARAYLRNDDEYKHEEWRLKDR